MRNMKMHRITAAFAAFLLTAGMAGAQVNPIRFDRAMELFRKGLFGEARALFNELEGNEAVTKGYALLCAEKLKADYAAEREDYLAAWPFSGLVPALQYQHGLNLFDVEDYAGVARAFADVSEEDVPAAERAEFHFKKGYALFRNGDADGALRDFAAVQTLSVNDYSAPAQYASGYIWYERRRFAEALDWFEQSVRDPRFEEISNFYIMECRFMMKDYAYVTRNAADLYGRVPEERRPRLARIISEAYLIRGDAETAKKYYDGIRDEGAKNRGDFFYAGALSYATGDYAGAIENYSKMTERRDSLGQIANYQLGYSYIQTRNKVSALEAFQAASEVRFDPQIREDAFFNFAKLSFDLNNNPGPFEAYLKQFPHVGRGEQIYSYMALAALHNRDYAAAVAAYDNIEELDPDQRSNYMKANYLRANQLIGNGSWRAAVPNLKAAAYYSDRRSGFNQLSRYWLAESYFRDGSYGEARALFNDLYNISALDNRPEGQLLPYNIAYTYFQEGDYAQASKWFGGYVSGGNVLNRRDAMIRRADCAFLVKDYAGAVKAYDEVLAAYDDRDDVYPVYQAGLAYGLLNQPAKKIEVLSRALKASPDAPFYGDAVYELGRAYVAGNQTDKAAGLFRDLAKTARDSSTVARSLIELGMIARNGARYDEALGYYKQVVEKMASSGYADDALLAIESIYQSKQEPERYLDYVDGLGRKAPVRSDAEREQILFNGAEQIFLAGNYQKALTSLQAYQERYPSGASVPTANFYIAECYRQLGMKDQACDFYRKVLDGGEGAFLEMSALQFAQLSYGMERYGDAFDGYRFLDEVARLDANRHAASVGMMRSAFGARNYDESVRCSDRVLLDKASSAAEKRTAEYVKAKSFLGMSRRDEAYRLFDQLAKEPSTDEGAEAAYLRILDSYDKGEYAEVENRVFDFSEKAGGQTYWLAKAFILLGDSYVDRDDFRQARATFESVRDGYPASRKDEVLDNVNMRLEKLSAMNQ